MQALIRVQATVRSQKARTLHNREHTSQPQTRPPRKSIERFDETRSEHTASFHSRRLSESIDPAINTFEESPKIVEIDTVRPKSRSRRTNTSMSECGEDPTYQTVSSPLPCQIPVRLSILDCRNFQDFDWSFTSDECRFSTAQSTPRFVNSGGSNAPVTPAKSVCGDSFFLGPGSGLCFGALYDLTFALNEQCISDFRGRKDACAGRVT
ncbi:PREDICTED: uncharacterized protein LOC104606600 [Nelumbo nucifera]|uniref:Uncharacterized protein LOC104606600 n=1 Tax=Nelumbo nucifera TaxID=4432 RepID=A0A1U8B2J2_NELNU|nr:PREDICTED: uncharacterized protein LOC104606600 [Nelumbo nucifera]